MRDFLAAAVWLALFPGQAFSQTTQGQSLADQTLEQLMNIEVVSAGKKAQSLETTAASVFVITPEDIRRSGMHSLPELLRLAPGVQVARTASGQWAISIRGFNSDFANKLLVLVDGRVVYNAEWAGVFWDMEEISLDNIERIEVVRGPGAAMWGANAVNGVINILTKTAESTQGGLVTAEAGTQDANTSARYGGAMGSRASYRVTGRYGHENSLPADPGNPGGGYKASSGWMSAAADFRIDWKPTPHDNVFFTGNAYHSSIGDEVPAISLATPTAPPRDVTEESLSGTMAGRWQHTFRNESSLETRVSWEHTEHGLALLPVGYSSIESELLYHFSLGSRNDVTWGADYRTARYRSTNTTLVGLQPANAAVDSYDSFLEDQFAIARNTLYFIAGVNLGHNQFTGLAVQPTGRLLWTPSKTLTSWVAASRAVRTPALIERGLEDTTFITPVAPGLLGVGYIVGEPTFRSESVIAFEAGQRVEIGRRVSVDVSGFRNRYLHLSSAQPGTPTLVPAGGSTPAYLFLPYFATNANHAQSYGLEASATWSAAQRWRLIGGYTWLHVNLDPYPGVQPGIYTPSQSPDCQFDVRSNWDVTRKLQLDAALYYTGAIRDAGVAQHLRGDLRLGWRPSQKVEFSTGIQDAFQPNHIELPSLLQGQRLLVGRNIYGAIVWRF
jgi:iron complex outermembrane receptor protein